MTEQRPYDTKCPRCIAAHNAGEKTALKLAAIGDFSPKYIAMATIQDALTVYCASAHGEGGNTMGLHDYETELEAAAVLSRIAAAQSSDPASDDLTVPLAFECAEKDVEIERLRAALIQVRGFAKVMDERNWCDLRLHIERQCDALEQREPATNEAQELVRKFNAWDGPDKR